MEALEDTLLHLVLGGQGGYGGGGGRGVQGRGGQQGDVIAMRGHKDGGRGHEEMVGGGVSHDSCASRRGQNLQLPHLLLPNVVIAVGHEVLLDLGEGKGEPGVGLGGRRKGGDLHVEILLEVTILGVSGEPQLLLPLLVPHGALAQHCHLGQRLLLHPLQRVTLRAQQLTHKVELKNIRKYL